MAQDNRRSHHVDYRIIYGNDLAYYGKDFPIDERWPQYVDFLLSQRLLLCQLVYNACIKHHDIFGVGWCRYLFRKMKKHHLEWFIRLYFKPNNRTRKIHIVQRIYDHITFSLVRRYYQSFYGREWIVTQEKILFLFKLHNSKFDPTYMFLANTDYKQFGLNRVEAHYRKYSLLAVWYRSRYRALDQRLARESQDREIIRNFAWMFDKAFRLPVEGRDTMYRVGATRCQLVEMNFDRYSLMLKQVVAKMNVLSIKDSTVKTKKKYKKPSYKIKSPSRSCKLKCCQRHKSIKKKSRICSLPYCPRHSLKLVKTVTYKRTEGPRPGFSGIAKPPFVRNRI